MATCPYCGQSNTKKDEFGYCVKYNCLEVSLVKEKYSKLLKQLTDAWSLPTYKRNYFDGSVYNPRQEKYNEIISKIYQLLGFVPLTVFDKLI